MTMRAALDRSLSFLLFVFLLPVIGGAVTFPDKPEPEHFYRDEAGLIMETEGKEIDHVAGELLSTEMVPIIVGETKIAVESRF